MDQRVQELASKLITYSTELQKGEKILIEVTGQNIPLVQALIKETYRVGATPFVTIKDPQITRQLLLHADEQQMESIGDWELARMKEMDAYIGIRGGGNANELADVPGDKMKLYMANYMHKVHGLERVPNTKWCVMRYPNESMAQLANMSTEAFTDFYFKVCNLDYQKMSMAMEPLVELMNRTDEVHIKGNGTDLKFSIKGIPAIKCDGKMNIPDGEIFTAPVKNSVNGFITYNAPAVYQGYTYENIRLEFVNGKIVQATANNTEKINQIFDTDEGARYIGEFAIGVNPYIYIPMKDTLFDEKIAGSFHFTPGKCYDEASNGNQSAIHWDLVCIQNPEYGGGEMYFDGRLIRKDGLFVIDELQGLNPEALT